MAEPTRSPLAKLTMDEVHDAVREMRLFYWRLYDGGRLDEASCVCSCLKMLGSGVWPRPESSDG